MFEFDEQDKRSEKIFGQFDMDVSEESSLKYMNYLKQNIKNRIFMYVMGNLKRLLTLKLLKFLPVTCQPNN